MSEQLAIVTDNKPPARLKGWKASFVKVLQRTPNVKLACQAAGVVRARAYAARENDEVFASLWDDAIAHSVDKLEAKAFALAQKGDTSLITFLLRCHKPQVYNPSTRVDAALLGGIVLIPAKAEGAE